MSNAWYYTDIHGRQQGPITLEALQSAVEGGLLAHANLIWHEGWPEWRKLADVAQEIGVRLPAAPPALPPRAAPAGPRVVVAERDGSRSAVIVVVLVVVGVVFLGFVGILMAIAIPAYQDYTVRAKIGQALAEVTAVRLQVSETLINEDRCPLNGEEGIKDERGYASEVIDKVVVGTLANDASTCAIEISLSNKVGLPSGEDHRILMYLDSDQRWQHETNVPKRYLPASMR
ncbi:GYF domain-containing protein [Pseudomarimonas arenosa]|uniref:DUF4339 domain-containing protein n=1 Tax=Pseudomarimonas arenosa TaxID=2774145 RepID=A0AAW3ZU12_9GAMM|nr:GYF domain-containing protein [Pseudomarimonas arenosa]MBD8527601.1 DUF4339 domain-containing protein [Pseudomarimonas arenosa]